MAAYTSTQSGDWNTNATWGGGGHPIDGDTATVAAGHTVTVSYGSPATVGTSGTNTTDAVVLIGNLVLNDVLTLRGRLTQRRSASVTIARNGSTTNGGLTFDPPATRAYSWQCPNTGSGTPAITVTGTAANRVPITTSARGGGNAWLDFSQLEDVAAPTLDWDYADVSRLGGAADSLGVGGRSIEYHASSGSSVHMDYVRWSNVGTFFFNLRSFTDVTFDVRNCDWRLPLNATMWGQAWSWGDRASGVKQFKDCTWHAAARHDIWQWGYDLILDGGVVSNTAVDVGGGAGVPKNCAIRNTASIVDIDIDGVYTADYDPNAVIEANVFYTHRGNPHYITTGAHAGGPTIIQDNIADADGYQPVDSGDFVLPSGDVTIQRNLLINKAGTLWTNVSTLGRVTVRRNTLYGAFGGCEGEGGGDPLHLVRFSSNLIVNQDDGIHQDPTAYVSHSTMNVDYNGFYQMLAAGNLDHPVLGQNSYLGAQSAGNWWTSGAYGDDNKGQHDIYGDPQFVDPTRTCVSWYNSIAGSGGSLANVRARMIEMNGTALDGSAATFDSRYTVAALKAYLRAGFTPQNAAFHNAGDPDDGSPDMGAIAWAAGGPAKPVLFARHYRNLRAA